MTASRVLLLLATVAAAALPLAAAGVSGDAGAPDRGRRGRRRARPARAPLAQKLSESLGQQVIVDNRPGAGGVLGADLAAKAPADGYTLLLTTTAIYAILPSLKKNLPYDPVRDFAPISRIATTSNVLVVNTSLPARHRSPSWYSSASKPGALNYASAGIGTPAHLAGEMLNLLAGHQDHARAVQGRRARAARRDRRQRPRHHHLADCRRRAHERRPRACARHDRHRAQSEPARPADHRRHRARLRDHAVVGHRRARRHAAPAAPR